MYTCVDWVSLHNRRVIAVYLFRTAVICRREQEVEVYFCKLVWGVTFRQDCMCCPKRTSAGVNTCDNDV